MDSWCEELFQARELNELADSKDDYTTLLPKYRDVFQTICSNIINKTLMMVNGTPFRLMEIEVYYKHDNHPDAFTHGDPVQQKFARWYFHRTGGKSYKSGTYKGLDIAFGGQKGNGAKGAYAGILIRAIHEVNLKTGALKGSRVEGSCMSVNKILELCEKEDIADFVQHFKVEPGSPLITQSDSKLYLTKFPADGDAVPAKWVKTVVSGPRVGLSLKRAHQHMDVFLMRHYRFHIMPEQMKKGKPQNLAGLIGAGKDGATVARDGGSDVKTVGRAMASIKKGRSTDLLDYISKNLSSSGAFLECYGAWLAAEAAGTLGNLGMGKGAKSKAKAKSPKSKTKKGSKKSSKKSDDETKEDDEEEDEKPKSKKRKASTKTSTKGKKKSKAKDEDEEEAEAEAEAEE